MRFKKQKISEKAFYTISSGDVTLSFSKNGSIVEAVIGSAKIPYPLTGMTYLKGFNNIGEVTADIGASKDECTFTRTQIDKHDRKCVVVENFTKVKNGIRWNVSLSGTGNLWTAPIITDINFAAKKQSRFWTSWSDPENRSRGWRDPLTLQKFRNSKWTYSNISHFTPEKGDYFSIPIATIADIDSDTGLSFAFSPEDHLLNMNLETKKTGSIVFTQENHRMGEGYPVKFSIDIVSHEADYKGGLRFYTERYSEYFEPSFLKADEMAGCGAYSGYEGSIDAERLRKMAFRTNWKLSDDFPWMGMFIPPVKNADEKWERACDEPTPEGKSSSTSCRQMNDYAIRMKQNGFYILNYFNVTELGRKMDAPTGNIGKDSDELWKSPVMFQKTFLPDAVLDPRLKTFYGAKVTDCGDPKYKEFILEQADRHIRYLPDTDGICIDRLDWLRFYNANADDGLSLYNGKPARALAESWKNFIEALSSKMHAAGKVVFGNPMTMRIDLMKHLDGYFSEHGESGPGLNSLALMSLRKTAITWTCMWWIKPVYKLKPDPDRFFQRHLLMGVYPTAPYPFNNHALRPHPVTDDYYLQYGPLLDAMRGKKWVLAPHCVNTQTTGVKVNLFQVKGGYSLPVTFGGKSQNATVIIKNIPDMKNLRVTALHPGTNEIMTVSCVTVGDSLKLNVPLKRGCAMVKLSY